MPSRRQPKGLTHTKGLGNRHRLQRERLLRMHVDGQPCPICQAPMHRDAARNRDGMALHADHWPVPRAIAGPQSLASRLVCGSCNCAAGGRLRAALAGQQVSDDSDRDLTVLAFAWP
jgi:hypothetical protein